jgi:hypothetical protein
MEKHLSIPPVVLPEQMPQRLPAPKFQLGQTVKWACVPTGDYGRVVGVVYGNEGSVRETGFHYAIQLDLNSPSYADGTRSDWAFEEDLELLPPIPPTNGDQES